MIEAMTPDEREHKLPNWAQDIINNLRREVRAGEEVNATLQWQNPGTDTWLDDRLSGEDKVRALPRGATITFELGKRGDFRATIHARVRRDSDGTTLYLMGSAGLVIQPEACNTAAVSVKP